MARAEKPKVVFSLLGPQRDAPTQEFRPTLALCSEPETFKVGRLVLLYEEKHREIADALVKDILKASPATEVEWRLITFKDPWHFEEVFDVLHRVMRDYHFEPEREYYAHLSTGTNTAQICLFSLTQARHFPGRLVSTVPPRYRQSRSSGIIEHDLDLSSYFTIFRQQREQQLQGIDLLKQGIPTRNLAYNALIQRIEAVATRSQAPLLLMGPTGAGKSELASRIHALKRRRNQLTGKYVEVNCATLTRDNAESTLFGHVRGAFTGALRSRTGLLTEADKGLLFLDEVGELHLDVQAMLLSALQTRRFRPMGENNELTSDFQLITGTNQDLRIAVREGRFREDLYARIRRWTFVLPGLKDRREDIEPNLDYELSRQHSRAEFTPEARELFVEFALSSQTLWPGNFRDLGYIVERLCTLAPGGRITPELVQQEIQILRSEWGLEGSTRQEVKLLQRLVPPQQLEGMDMFERVQLEHVLGVCAESNSISEAGRKLFNVSLGTRPRGNAADRLGKYLRKRGLSFERIRSGRSTGLG